MTKTVTVNGRAYPWPVRPAIAICLDGCEPAYLDAAIAAGLMPVLARIRDQGTDRISHSAMPSFTNPNNMSIATGRPPAVHGICGNYLFDPETGTEVMMNDVRFLRAPTVFAGFHDAGARVAIVTAKDKLRALLGAPARHGQRAGRCAFRRNGRTARQRPNTGSTTPATGWAGRCRTSIRPSCRNSSLPPG
jgi:phosphonoacetate hydrolase